MYKKDLDYLLQTSCPRAVLLYGESDFLIKYYSNKIANTSEKTVFYYDDYDFNTVMEILGQGSLFNDKNTVVLKLIKKLPLQEIKQMISALCRNKNNYLIIEFYKSESKGATEYTRDCKAMGLGFKDTTLGNECVDVRFFAPTPYESLFFFKRESKKIKP